MISKELQEILDKNTNSKARVKYYRFVVDLKSTAKNLVTKVTSKSWK